MHFSLRSIYPALATGSRQLLVACVALTLLSPLTFGANDTATYEQKLKTLHAHIEALKKQLNSVKTERGKLQKKLQKSETDIGELENKIHHINRQLKKQNSDLQSLQQQQQNLQQERRGQQAQIAAEVRSAYRAGPQTPLRLLLNQRSPERISRMSKYHDYILAARQHKLKQYLATLDQLDALKPQILARQKSLKHQRQQLGLRQRELHQQQSQRQQALKKLASVIASKDAKLRQNNQNSARLQSLLNEMTATVGHTGSTPSGVAFSHLRGKLPWPARGKLIHRYGSRKMTGQLSWQGLVIAAQAGTPVRAIHSGRVIFAEYLRGHGLLIIIDHGEGYMSLYAHNQSLLKQLGDTVNGGDIIARMGNSGGQSYSGLYFEIRHNGKPTNPNNWLARA